MAGADLDVVAAVIRGAADVQRLVDVDDEMHDEPQRLGALIARLLRIGEHLAEARERREHVALGRMNELVDRGSRLGKPCARRQVGDVHVMPGTRALPLRLVANLVGPKSELRERLAGTQRLHIHARRGAELLLREIACDSVTDGPPRERRRCGPRREEPGDDEA